MITIEELTQKLRIPKKGTYSSKGNYVVDIDDSDEFGKIYSLLDRNEEVDYLEESSVLNFDSSSILYQYEGYQIAVIADFKEDQYRLVISKA